MRDEYWLVTRIQQVEVHGPGMTEEEARAAAYYLFSRDECESAETVDYMTEEEVRSSDVVGRPTR